MRTAVSWPGAAQCRTLLRTVPWKLFLGRSGLLPHVGLLVLFGLSFLISTHVHMSVGLALSAEAVTTALVCTIYAFIGGVTRKWSVLPIALGASVLTVSLSIGATAFLNETLAVLGPSSPLRLLLWPATLLVGVSAGIFVFGGYLALLTLLGYENTQAFTVLDHPGFKHFVRLRVRADGSGIDGWCIGAADPLAANAQTVLVDQFSWRPFSGR